MSYTPTTWTTGDTITASALNKIENGIADAGGGGVASVCVIYDNSWGGTVSGGYGYAQYTQNRYSIEGPMTDMSGNAPYFSRFYFSIPLTSSDDDFKPYILFDTVFDGMSSYTITGNISTTKIQANRRSGASTWDSITYYGFEVMGDGVITVTYAD